MTTAIERLTNIENRIERIEHGREEALAQTLALQGTIREGQTQIMTIVRDVLFLVMLGIGIAIMAL